MRRVTLGLMAGLVLAGICPRVGAAADMSFKAPPRPVVAAYDWTGIYVGVGAGWVHSSYDWRYTNPLPATLAPFSSSADDAVVSGLVGSQLQLGQFVLGVEAAINGFAGAQLASTAGCTAIAGVVCQVQPRSIVTVGGRLGYAWNDWMIYGTGGAAGGSVHTQLVVPPGGAFDGTQSYYIGWFAGIGGEYALYRGPLADLIVGAEYQHIDLGTELHLSPLDGFTACPPGINCRNVSATEDLVRVRAALKFNPRNWR